MSLVTFRGKAFDCKRFHEGLIKLLLCFSSAFVNTLTNNDVNQNVRTGVSSDFRIVAEIIFQCIDYLKSISSISRNSVGM